MPKTPVIVPSTSSFARSPASLQSPSKLKGQNHIPNAPMNHESKIEDVDEAAPLSLSARVAIVSPFCLRVDIDRFEGEVEVGTTAATDRIPNDRKICLGVPSETDARLAKANGGDA